MGKFVNLKRFTSSPNFWPLLVVVFVAWLATKPFFGSGYFNMHDDLQMMRQLEMEKCFQDLQIPCRWVPDMGYGFGYPLFNFYPPLPYLTGEAFRLVGYPFVDTAKGLFILAFFASGISMYFLAKEFFGRIGGTLSAVFYIWAPYHAVDAYVRGAMNESWGLIWFPAILLFSYKLLQKPSFVVTLPKKATLADRLKNALLSESTKWAILVALTWFALFTSHNLMVIVFTPFFAVWCLAWIVKFRQWKNILPLLIGGISAFALAAFFSIPVFLEKNIVQTDSLVRGYYEYTAHFPSIGQLLFSRFWGYGPSVWLLDDKMSFQIGWFHWGTALVVGVLLVIRTLRTRKLDKTFFALAVLGFTALGATFMAHPRSTPIWQHISALQFIQFPWRYLTMIILGTSFIAGGITKFFPKVVNFFLLIILSIAVIAYSWNYFLPEHGHLGPLTDQEKFSGAAWELQQTAGIYDYLPNTAMTAPKGPRTVQAEIMNGKGTVVEGQSGTDWEKFAVNAETDATIRIGLLDFPEWKIFVDGKEVTKYIPKTEEWGRIYVDIPAGNHDVYAKLFNTPARTAGNAISLVSWIVLAVILIYRRKKLSLA